MTAVWEKDKQNHGDPAPRSRLRVSTPPFVPAVQKAATSEKPEDQKMCRVMWGKYPCPGPDCARVHIRWCSKPACIISEEKPECVLWHGHTRAVLQREKAKKKKEAEQKCVQEADKRKCQDRPKPQTAQAGNGNGGAPHRAPHRKQPFSKGNQRQRSWQSANPSTHYKHASPPPESPWTRPRSQGDYIMAPAPAESAWAKPLPYIAPVGVQPILPQEAITANPRVQLQQLLQSMLMLL